jgi:uncharacterized protein (TIGR02145 family)
MRKILPFLLLILLFMGCAKNHIPVIASLICSPENRSAGTQFTFNVTASDEDGDQLAYRWSADGGEFMDSANQIQAKWKSPVDGSGKTFTIKVVVADAESEAYREIQILLGAPQLGNLEGQVNFTNFKIPVNQAIITVGDKTATTNTDGYFFMPGIVVGDYALKITKPDFSVFNSNIKISLNDTLQVNVEITSVNYSTKLSGTISDQDGVPLENVLMVVLNPDGTESKLKATTNAAGFYRLWYIPFGKRTISVKKTTTEDNSYVAFQQVMDFQEIETQLNLTMTRLVLRGTFTDLRDNHVYAFKTIGNSTWMTENLSYLPNVSPGTKGSKEDPYYYVYEYQGTSVSEAVDAWYYKQYGVLYNLPAAMAACPNGWHLPDSDVEYNGLISTVSSPAGKKLKSTSGWTDHGNGDNSSGFAAFPGGKLNEKGEFINTGDAAYFWTTTIRTLSINKVLFFNSDNHDCPLKID